MIGWAWEGRAGSGSGCGVSDDEGSAREAAEAWLRSAGHGTALLGMARLTDGTTALSAWWQPLGCRRRSRRLRDGRIIWARVPARESARAKDR